MAHVFADRIMETSTVTGTGAVSVAGAITGYATLASRLEVGDTFDYVIYSVDAGGSPTGAWETGVGTYTATNTFSRAVQTSSNGDALVDFAAGTKRVVVTLTAALIAELVASAAPQPYVVRFGFTTTPTATEILLIAVIEEAVTFADGLGVGSVGYIGVNPAAETTFTVRKNGTNSGSIVVDTAGVIDFNTVGGPLSFAPGDVLSVEGPATPDTTIANCAFALIAERD